MESNQTTEKSRNMKILGLMQKEKDLKAAGKLDSTKPKPTSAAKDHKKNMKFNSKK